MDRLLATELKLCHDLQPGILRPLGWEGLL